MMVDAWYNMLLEIIFELTHIGLCWSVASIASFAFKPYFAKKSFLTTALISKSGLPIPKRTPSLMLWGKIKHVYVYIVVLLEKVATIACFIQEESSVLDETGCCGNPFR